MTTFRILDSSSPSERREWIDLWELWPAREIHAHPSYVALFASEEGVAKAAAFESANGCVLFPFILRDVIDQDGGVPRARDLTTPYGYGGAFVWNVRDGKELADEFWTRFEEWTRSSRIASEFLRLSLFPEALLHYPGVVEIKQDNVVVDLALSPDDLWMSFEQKVRKNVKKAQRSGVVIELDEVGHRFEDFLHIYESTLNRRGAVQNYYFTRDFFSRIHDELKGQFVYFHALHEGNVVSTELVLLSQKSAYSFLGGTLEEAFDLRPNDLLKFEIMRWSASSGRRWFVLGGGYEAGDGIFRYKRAFAPTGARPFSVGSRINDPDLYQKLVDERLRSRETPIRPGFFPAYRG